MDAFAAYMEYHIVMAPPNIRPVTPHALIADVMGDRFDQGPDYTNWRPAGSGDWLLIHTTGGAGRLAAQASGHCYDVNPGDVILYSPGDPQDYATAPSPGRWQLQWAHFHPRPEWRAWLHWPEILPGVGHRRITAPETAAALTAALDRMIAHRRQPWEGARDLAMNALEEALLWIETTARADAHWQLDPACAARWIISPPTPPHLSTSPPSPPTVPYRPRASGTSSPPPPASAPNTTPRNLNSAKPPNSSPTPALTSPKWPPPPASPIPFTFQNASAATSVTRRRGTRSSKRLIGGRAHSFACCLSLKGK